MPVLDKGTRYFYHDSRWDACRRCGDNGDLRFGLCWDCGAWYWHGWKVVFHPIRLFNYFVKPIKMRLAGFVPAKQAHPLFSMPGGAPQDDPDIGK